jgi:hypothetical protein
LACEERISIDCARVMRGISSSANDVTPFDARTATSSLLVRAPSGDISVWPLRSRAISSTPSAADIGRWILKTISAAATAAPASGTMFAPASA